MEQLIFGCFVHFVYAVSNLKKKNLKNRFTNDRKSGEHNYIKNKIIGVKHIPNHLLFKKSISKIIDTY